MKKKLKDAEKKIENAEEKPESAGVEPGDTEKASAEEVGKKPKSKNKIRRKKIAGGAELAAAFILAALSGWLFFNTRGTRLLYISVTLGRISRYYWIFLAAALIFLAIGLFTLRSRRREEHDVLQEEKGNCNSSDNNVI